MARATSAGFAEKPPDVLLVVPGPTTLAGHNQASYLSYILDFFIEQVLFKGLNALIVLAVVAGIWEVETDYFLPD